MNNEKDNTTSNRKQEEAEEVDDPNIRDHGLAVNVGDIVIKGEVEEDGLLPQAHVSLPPGMEQQQGTLLEEQNDNNVGGLNPPLTTKKPLIPTPNQPFQYYTNANSQTPNRLSEMEIPMIIHKDDTSTCVSSITMPVALLQPTTTITHPSPIIIGNHDDRHHYDQEDITTKKAPSNAAAMEAATSQHQQLLQEKGLLRLSYPPPPPTSSCTTTTNKQQSDSGIPTTTNTSDDNHPNHHHPASKSLTCKEQLLLEKGVVRHTRRSLGTNSSSYDNNNNNSHPKTNVSSTNDYTVVDQNQTQLDEKGVLRLSGSNNNRMAVASSAMNHQKHQLNEKGILRISHTGSHHQQKHPHAAFSAMNQQQDQLGQKGILRISHNGSHPRPPQEGAAVVSSTVSQGLLSQKRRSDNSNDSTAFIATEASMPLHPLPRGDDDINVPPNDNDSETISVPNQSHPNLSSTPGAHHIVTPTTPRMTSNHDTASGPDDHSSNNNESNHNHPQPEAAINNMDLAVANPIHDDEEASGNDLQHAESVPSGLSSRKDKWWNELNHGKFLIGGVLVVVLLVGLVIVASICGSGLCQADDHQDGLASVVNETTQLLDREREKDIQEFLMISFGDDNYFGEHQQEAQVAEVREKAALWMAHEDPLQLDVPRHSQSSQSFLQRFILVLFYMETTRQYLWRSCNSPSSTTGIHNHLGESSKPCYHPNTEEVYYNLASPWLTGDHECDWAGIFCSKSGGIEHNGTMRTVEAIELQTQGLNGQLPTELAMLSHLRDINLYNNSIGATIPSDLCQLNTLEWMRLTLNKFIGTIPACLFELPKLQVLDLGFNQLSGALPSKIGSFQGRALLIYNTILTGSIPSEMGLASDLKYILLENNLLSGELPTEMGNLKDMAHFFAYDNLLGSTMPSEVGRLSRLAILDLSLNKIGGTLPEELYLGFQTSLNILKISGCTFNGTLSTNVGLMTNLRRLDISNNADIEGSIPSQISNLSNLRALKIQGTYMSGTVPDILCSSAYQSLEMVADCLGNASTGIAPVSCSCCTTCCDQGTGDCEVS